MLSRLMILNHMLGTKGIAPVSSEDSNHPEAHKANNTIDLVTIEVQSRGWWWNTEKDFDLAPDVQGHIILPGDILSVDPVDVTSALVRRGGKLYDPVNHTYAIDEVVRVDMILQLPIEDMPDAFSQYLMHEAAVRYYMDGDAELRKGQALQLRSEAAYQRLNQANIERQDINIRNSSYGLLMRTRSRGGHFRPDRPGGR